MDPIRFNAYRHIYQHKKQVFIKVWLVVLFLLLLLLLFVPWTQNIRAKGAVTALLQEQRPQDIHTVIAGRIEKWFVKEGDFVKKGDTLARLSEIKTDYLDPNLLKRTEEQMQAKRSSVDYYQGKIATTETQLQALKGALQAKLDQLTTKFRQTEIKAQSDSMEMVAAINDWKIANLQYNRQKTLHDSGLVSLTQLEQRNQFYQSAQAKKVSAENKFLATKQELSIVRLEFNAVQQEYAEKLSKVESERLGALSSVATGQGDLAKLQNQHTTYAIRNGMYFITAPQDGQVVQMVKSGLGETVKDGEALMRIVPRQVDYAVEMYVKPIDLPLVAPGQQVRFLFDGFPAIVFSGWPDASYGTYVGIVTAVENDVSANGQFKILVKEDSSYRKWPRQLKLGTGARGIALLKNVPLWYEIWRNINSFPPDYYKPSTEKK